MTKTAMCHLRRLPLYLVSAGCPPKQKPLSPEAHQLTGSKARAMCSVLWIRHGRLTTWQ